MTDHKAYLRYRIRILPQQLAAARVRVVHLEREAMRYGFADLLSTVPEGGRFDPSNIVHSDAVIGIFGSCEWDELSDDGQAWITAIIRETLARAGYSDLPPSSGLPPQRRSGAARVAPTRGAIGGEQ